MEKQMLGKSHFYEGDVVEITDDLDSSRIGKYGIVKKNDDEWLGVVTGYVAYFQINYPDNACFADKCLKLIAPAKGTPSWEERFTHAPQVAENPQPNKVSFEQRVEIAGRVMQGYLASCAMVDNPPPAHAVKKVMEYTDALIAELEKT